MLVTGAKLITLLLERQGVEVVAGIPGGSVLPLYDALTSSTIRHILVRHEQAAGFLAQGFSRSRGIPGVCIATSGPGAMNLLTAVADAHADSIPLVAITGQVNSYLIGTDAFQEVDTFGLSFPIAKHSMMVKTPEELLVAIPRAFSLALSGRPGPVLIDIPRDVQTAQIEVNELPEPGRKVLGPENFNMPEAVLDKSVDEAVELLCSAKRPVLFAGGGASNDEASSLILKLVENYSIPVVTSLMGIGVIPFDNKFNFGMVGMHGTPVANRAMHDSDLILACGVRFDDRATGIIREFCPNARIIHIDIDAAEVNKIYRTQVSLIGDSGDVLARILERLSSSEKKAAQTPERTKWFLFLEEQKMAYIRGLRREPGNPNDFIASLPDSAEKGGCSRENLLVTTDVGQHQMWAAQSYPVFRPRQFMTSGSLGTMGFGLPVAIGAAIANPGKRVICISGDGSIMMNIQELATLRENDLNVTVILLDNGALGMVRQQQEFLYNKNYSASIYESAPDVLRVAEGFGIESIEAGSKDWEKKAFGKKGPCFVRFYVDQKENVFPFVPAGKPNIDPILG